MTDPVATVLVVDDDAASLSALFECLRRAGHRVLGARDGASALERAENGKPALILLDVMMPDLDGFETCKRLKRNAATADIPVLFLTALTDTSEKLKGFEAGAVDYLTKPVIPALLLARVSTQLELKEARDWLKDRNAILTKEVARQVVELKAAKEAAGILEAHAHESVVSLLNRCHEALKRTRGAVMIPLSTVKAAVRAPRSRRSARPRP